MLELQLPDMRCRYSSWRSNSSRSGTGGELLRRFMDEEASRPSNWFFQLRIWQSSWFLRHPTRPKHSLNLNPKSVPWVMTADTCERSYGFARRETHPILDPEPSGVRLQASQSHEHC